jgi:predicted nucleic acid-binding protein
VVAGILGVLIEAKHQGLITQVKPILDALINEADFWVSERLYRHVLQTVEGEPRSWWDELTLAVSVFS